MEHFELAIATDYLPSVTMEDIEDRLRAIKNAGFTHIHWCEEWGGDYTYSSYEIAQIKELVEKYELKSKGLHSTHGTWTKNIYRDGHYRRDFTSDNEYNRKAGVELIMNRVDLAAALGASEIVLHLYIPFLTLGTDEQAKEAFYVQVEKSLDELQPYCLEKGVRICMENLFEFPEEWMLYSWDRLFARYPKEFLGVCYDAGHANMRWHADAIDVLKKYSDRIFCVHLHDNMDTMDAHLLPGMGTVNWDAAMELLAKSAYELPLTLELACKMMSEQEYLAKAYEIGKKLTEIYISYKNDSGV